MVAKSEIGSILVVDCGAVLTKAMLLDQIGGEYRFVASGEAPTTGGAPARDVTQGIAEAVEQIARVTGRQFFDDEAGLITPQASNRRGVDAFAATVSAGEPLQIVLSGLVPDLSVASARRAAAGTYSRVAAVLGGGEGGSLSDEERVRAIRQAEPDVVLLAGGVDGGAERPVLDAAKAATLACAMMAREDRPTIIYAGNAQLRRAVTEIVADEAQLRVVDNVRPTLDDEYVWDAQQELQDLFRQGKMTSVPGLATPAEWSAVPVTPTAHAYGQLIQYLWYLGDPDTGFLGIDIGGASTTVAAVFDEQLHLTVDGSTGVAFGGSHLIEDGSLDEVVRWIPEAVAPHKLRALMINKSIHPASVPQTEIELYLEQALACAAIHRTVELARPGWRASAAQLRPGLMPLCDTILLSGASLTRAPRPGQAALLILNAVQPVGVSTLVMDRYGLAPALGSVAAVKPLAAVEALDAGGFTNLATVVAPVGGDARPGDIIMGVRVSYDDGSELDVEVAYGEIEVLPLPLGQEAVLELRPTKGFDVGLGGPGKGGKRRVSGGQAGLILDARGRPLPLAEDREDAHQQMQEWLYHVGG
jgi:uncharacterized protein (TIGR01319 family)